MSISARNVFEGKISAITEGPVHAEVSLTTDGGDTIVAVVTETSVKTLGLAVGKVAKAFVKAPGIMVLADESGLRFSARNHLSGSVSAVVPGAVNSEVVVTLAGGSQVKAVVTNEAVAEMQLTAGKPASVLFKASQVILGVPV